MVASAAFAAILAGMGVSIPSVLLIAALLNLLVAAYIYSLLPEFMMRFLVWIATHTLYRIRHEGLEHIPEEGPCVLVCNHVSFMDALILAVLNFVFRTARAIPIAPAKEDPQAKARAFDAVAAALAEGEVVCIFPEGKITYDGQINPFKSGIEEIVARTPVPVVPMALCGMWGSFFSRRYGPAMLSWPRRAWSRIALKAAAPVPAAQVSAAGLQQAVSQLRGDWQ